MRRVSAPLSVPPPHEFRARFINVSNPTEIIMHKFTATAVLALTTLIGSSPLAAQTAAPATPAPKAAAVPAGVPATPRARISPHETISVTIGGRTGPRVTLTYGRPYSKDSKTGEIRKIWGGLVPWSKADRLGSDEATLLLTQQPLVIGETTIPAGAYTLYTVPSETGATKLAFSSNLGKWGIPVDETHDVARVDLKKSTFEKSVDQLTITLENDAATGGGVLRIWWETTQFSLPFTVKKA